jgi:hypothetical protein
MKKKYRPLKTNQLERYIQIPVDGMHVFISYLEYWISNFKVHVEFGAFVEQLSEKKKCLENHEMEIARAIDEEWPPTNISFQLAEIAADLDENFAVIHEPIEWWLPTRASGRTRELAAALDGLVEKISGEMEVIEEQVKHLLRGEAYEMPLPTWMQQQSLRASS